MSSQLFIYQAKINMRQMGDGEGKGDFSVLENQRTLGKLQ